MSKSQDLYLFGLIIASNLQVLTLLGIGYFLPSELDRINPDVSWEKIIWPLVVGGVLHMYITLVRVLVRKGLKKKDSN